MLRAAALPRSLPGSAHAHRLDRAILASLLALALLPVAIAEIPAMVDYPNHLARMSILARAGSAAAHPLYEVAWAPYPNLAMDVLVPPLARLVGVAAATKLFLLVAQSLVVAGAAALAAAARGSLLAAGATGCMLLSAMPISFGFVNFTFALGLALLAAAAWLRLEGRPLALRLAVHAAAVVALWFSHLFALGVYGVAIGIVELHRAVRDRSPVGPFLLLVAGMAAPVLAVSIAAGAGGGSVGGTGTEWHLESKLFWLAPLNGWNRQVSGLLTLALALPLCLAFTRRKVRLVGAGPWLAAGFGALFLLLPFRLFDTAFVDGRALLAGSLILPAFAAFAPLDRRIRHRAAALIALVFAANVGFSAFAQWGYRAEYRSLLGAFEAMPKGSRLLPAEGGEAGDPPADLLGYPMYHAAALAVHARDAFVPTLFASPGKQPLRTNASVERLKVLEGGPVPIALLARLAAGERPPPGFAYVADWARDFDFLLLVNPAGAPLRTDLLEPVGDGRRFVLYRIRKPL